MLNVYSSLPRNACFNTRKNILSFNQMPLKMDTYVYVRIDVTSSKRGSIFQSISARMDFIAHLFKEMSLDKSVLPKFFTQVGFLLLRDVFVSHLFIVRKSCY